MIKDKFRVGLIGCGRIAQSHILACLEIEDIELVAVADAVSEVAASVGEEIGLSKHYTAFNEMLDQESLNAVIICSPPNTHFSIANQAIARGINVLCEKPFTIHYEEAIELKNLAEQKNMVLMMASKFRFVEDVIKSRGIIQSGVLGEVLLFELAFCSRLNMGNRWNSKKEISGGGVLMDNGPHAVDIARFLVGAIDQVQARQGRQAQELDVEDTSQLQFQTTNGVIGTVDLSWSIHKESDYYISIFGTEGTLQVGWKDSRYRQVDKKDWTVFGTGYNKQTAFLNQLRHFIACIRGEEKPIITADDAAQSVGVIEAAYHSIENKRWLYVDREKGMVA